MARFNIRKLKKLNLHLFRQLPPEQKRMTVSTLLTLVRIALAPVIVIAMLYAHWGTACVLFIIAAFTDASDGMLARIRNERTVLGACLDPLADKILIVSCFCTIGFVQSPLFVLPLWFVWLIVCKEFVQIVGGCLLYSYKGYIRVRPTYLGKVTTVVQMGFIIWLFACYFFSWVPLKTYYAMLTLVISLVLASFMQYVAIGIRFLTG